jgi:predicted CopG family antitoxin
MAVKTIALDPPTYELLRRARQEGETFSDTVRRLATPRHRTSEYAGIWADMPKRDQRLIAAGLRKSKERAKARIRALASA